MLAPVYTVVIVCAPSWSGCRVTLDVRRVGDSSLPDARPDVDDLGHGLPGPLRRLRSGVARGEPGEVALEPGRRADDQGPRGRAAEVGERVVRPARREDGLARPAGDELVAELERELALDDVEQLVEGVVV